MGGVINVIARYTENKNSESFINDMKVPAIKLVAMYIGQVSDLSPIFFYILYYIYSLFVHFFTSICYLIWVKKFLFK